MNAETREEWSALVYQVRASAIPDRSPALGALYELALKDGQRALARYRGLSQQERTDIILNKFVETRRHLVDASNPRGLFITAVTRAALSALRRMKTVDKFQAELSAAADVSLRSEDDTVHTLSLVQLLGRLSSRDQQVVRAVHSGEDREDVARRFGTTRANVDQIVSRVARMGRQR